MWVLTIFGLFAVGVCVAALIRGAATLSAEDQRGLLDASAAEHERRDAAQ